LDFRFKEPLAEGFGCSEVNDLWVCLELKEISVEGEVEEVIRAAKKIWDGHGRGRA
jgi:hypothetical protein